MNRFLCIPTLAAVATVLLQGCSGPQEDPRVSFCRGLASDLTGQPVADWVHTGERIVEPEYAEVKVRSGERRVSCWYAYEAVEPGAMEQATPLLAYATLPYQVEVDGERLGGERLKAAVARQQKEFGRAMLDQARKGLEDAAGQAGEAIRKAAQP